MAVGEDGHDTEALKAEIERLREGLCIIGAQPASLPFGTPWVHWASMARNVLEGKDPYGDVPAAPKKRREDPVWEQ